VSAPTDSFSDTSRRALESRALDVDFAVEHDVRPVLTAADLPGEFLGNPWAVVPGMLFPWVDPITGARTWQYRPDTPVQNDKGDPIKYVFPTDEHQNLGRVREARNGRTPAVSLIVEGTMQSLAAARYAPDDVAVYAIPGCWGWSSGKAPSGPLISMAGTQVVVCLDADAATNPDVYAAGDRMRDAVQAMTGSEPTFARLGSGGSVGLDDLLATAPDDHRSSIIENLIKNAKSKPADRKPPGKPRKRDDGSMPTNDTVLATTWADAHLGLFRWLATDERWLQFRLGRWEESSGSVAGSSIGVFLDQVAETVRVAGDEDTADQLLSNGKLVAVRSRASAYEPLHIRRDELDLHPRLWNAGNGVIDLETGEVREHDPELLLTTGSDVPHVPDAVCPRFDDFLAEVLPDDDVRDYILRVFGVAMFGEVRGDAQIFPVLIGEGRNGKGALVRIMEKLFGRHAVKINASALMERKFDAHEEEIAKLFGKRLATAEETARGAKWHTGRIQSWTGGDTLSGRFMRENSFEFVPSHTLVMTTNHRPNVQVDDSAFWKRYREIPFNVSVEGREDSSLEPYIIGQELPGVLNRLLGSVRVYLEHGLDTPEAVLVATAEARDDTNHVARFAEELLIVTDDESDRLLTADVYERAHKWWSQNVQNEPIPHSGGKNSFNDQLARALGFTERSRNPRKAKLGGRVQLAWHRLRWLGEGGSERLPRLAPLGNPTSATDAATDVSTAQNASTAPTPVAEVDGPVADEVAEVNDLEITNPAGQSAVVASVAEVAEKTEHLSNKENDKEGVLNRSSRALSLGAQQEEGPTSATRQPEPPVVFDLETADAEQLYDHPDPRAFVRIAGRSTAEGVVVDTGPDAVVESVLSSQRVIGHNIVHFDLPALARVDDRVDVLTMTRDRRVLDTMITESVLHPILNDKSAGAVAKAAKWFKLDAVCERRGIGGKVDEIARLAKLHGGFDQIPVDDPDYRTYVAGDVGATRMLAGLQAAEIAQLSPVRREYLWREHRVHAIAATMGAQGFLVDRGLLDERFWQAYGRKQSLSRSLIARYGIPTTKADGKPAESPAATKGGKEAILGAFDSLGVNVAAMETTPKGAIAFGREPMGRLAEAYAEHPHAEEITALAELVADVNGVRTVYGTALEALRADGRVHPEVATFQASGRWSVRKPGLTVFGKRNGRHVERAVFTAAPGNALFAIDLSQIDSRSIAVHSQDHAYLDLFRPGLDAHEIVARMVWGDAAYDADRKTLRDRVKAITHGLPYGMGLEKLVATTKVPEVEAQRVIDTMNERFPRLQAWKDEVREQAASGELDNGFGRIMMCEPSRAFTQGPALIGQGTARDLMMECLLNLPDFCVRMLRAQVHDEAVFEVPLALADQIVPRIEQAFNFEWAPDPSFRPVQIVAEAGKLGTSWADCYS
jgi:P4 family phage/plasmid primase-like protien